MKRYIILLIYICFISTIILKCYPNPGPDEYINIQVSNDTLPVISWDGEPAGRIFVIKDSIFFWAIHTPDRDSLISPIKYGELPENAEIMDTKPIDSLLFGKPLSIGAEYRIQIWRNNEYAVGEKEFILGN